MKKTLIVEELTKLLESIESEGYCNNYDRLDYELNVKLRGMTYFDSTELAAMYPKKYTARINKEFTDETIQEIVDEAIEWEGRSFIEDYLKGCSISSREWYMEEVMPKIEAETPTGYFLLDKIKTKAGKIKELNKWIRNEEEEKKAIDQVCDAGLYGRMGGHFCFRTGIRIKIDTFLNEIDECYSFEEANQKYREILKSHERALFILDQAKKTVDSIKKTGMLDEIKHRIDDFIDEWDKQDQAAREIKQAKTLAKKHGYILATILN